MALNADVLIANDVRAACRLLLVLVELLLFVMHLAVRCRASLPHLRISVRYCGKLHAGG